MADRIVADVADERAIRRLISLYCDAVARLDADAAAALFAEDAVIRIADYPERAGREKIRSGMRRTFAGFDLLHQRCDTGLIDVSGDRANARMTVFEACRRTGEDSLGLIFGIYEDTYVKLEEGWRFHRRRYSLQAQVGVPLGSIDLVAGFAPELIFSA